MMRLILLVLLLIATPAFGEILIGDTGDPSSSDSTMNGSDEWHFTASDKWTGTAGTATTACVRMSDWLATGGIKVAIYSSAGSLLATSSEITSSDGVGSDWYCNTISYTTSAVGYILALCGDDEAQYFTPYYTADSSWNMNVDTSSSYASAPSSITPFTTGSGGINVGTLAMRIEGTTGGGASTHPWFYIQQQAGQ